MERPLLYFAQKLVRSQEKALDVLQEVWLKAFQTIRSLENPSSVRAWLYRLTRGLAIDCIRKEITEEKRELAHAEEKTDSDEEPTFAVEDAAAMHRALDIRHRDVLVLHFLEEMTVTEVGIALDCPPGTVKSRILYAKRALQAALEGERHESPT